MSYEHCLLDARAACEYRWVTPKLHANVFGWTPASHVSVSVRTPAFHTSVVVHMLALQNALTYVRLS